MKFTREVVTEIRRELEAKLKELSEKHGCQIHLRGGSFTPYRMTTGIEGRIIEGPENLFMARMSITPTDIGKQYRLGDRVYQLAGFRKSRGRSCKLIRMVDGREFVCRPEDLVGKEL